MGEEQPLATYDYVTGSPQQAFEFLKRTRSELRMLRFVRVWPVPDQTGVRRHEAYAVQWFGMAVVFIAVVGAMWRRELRARRRPVRNKTHE